MLPLWLLLPPLLLLLQHNINCCCCCCCHAYVQALKSHLSSLGLSLVVTSLWGAAVAGHFDEDLFAGTRG
jgi:hypothetical protein